MSKHTRLPWETEGNPSDDPDPRWLIVSMTAETILAVTCGGNDQANAEFIVRACNSHEDLLKACEKSWKLLQEVARMNIQPFPTMAVDLNNELRELIAKATG